MPGKVKKGGTWRTMQKPLGKVGGAWRGAEKGWTKKGGVWVPWYSSAPPVVPLPAAPKMFRVSARSSVTVTFRWVENDAADNVIDYQFVCVPHGGGIWEGSDPYLSNTPSYVTDTTGGMFDSRAIPVGTPGGFATTTYNMNQNGTKKSFRVRARNANGYGPWSDMIFFPSDQGWSATFQELPLAPNLSVTDVALSPNNIFSFTLNGADALQTGQGTASCRVGFGRVSADSGMQQPASASTYTEPSIPATISFATGYSFLVDELAGNSIWPQVLISNNNATDFVYAIHFTTQAIKEVPLRPELNYIQELFTLTAGTDTASGGAFPDRGFKVAGAHTNSQQVGELQPRYLFDNTGTWVVLSRDGAYAGSLEANTPSGVLQKIISIGYGWGQGESARQRPAGLYYPYTEAPWGRETIVWSPSISNTDELPWQFVSGQTYTITLLRSP